MASIAFNPNVQKSGIFQAIKSCMPPSSGFNMKINQITVWVDNQENHHEKIIKTYPKYGVILAQIGPSTSLPAPCPTSSIPIYEGMTVYYAGFSEDDGTYFCHKGRVSSITSNNQQFTIDGSTVSISPGSPIFTYDKVNHIVHLTGVIGKTPNSTIRAIHIDCFRQEQILPTDELGEERGGVQVQVGEFKGIETSNGGRGPRLIRINGPTEATYRLTFIDGSGKKTHPHDDDNYNDRKKCPQLYYNALQAFVNRYNIDHAVPREFQFEFFKTTYTATLE